MRNPVLLIHGIDDRSFVFNRMAAYLREQGWLVHSLDLEPNNGAAGLDELAEQIARYAALHFVNGVLFDIVGFSMGGLVARYYVQRLGGLERIQRLITISSPHHGTLAGYIRWNKGARQMRPRSLFLQDLNRDAERLDTIRFSSIWTPLDLMIVPAKSSVTPWGHSVRIAVPAHPLMVRDRRVLREVARALSEQTGDTIA